MVSHNLSLTRVPHQALEGLCQLEEAYGTCCGYCYHPSPLCMVWYNTICLEGESNHQRGLGNQSPKDLGKTHHPALGRDQQRESQSCSGLNELCEHE